MANAKPLLHQNAAMLNATTAAAAAAIVGRERCRGTLGAADAVLRSRVTTHSHAAGTTWIKDNRQFRTSNLTPRINKMPGGAAHASGVKIRGQKGSPPTSLP